MRSLHTFGGGLSKLFLTDRLVTDENTACESRGEATERAGRELNHSRFAHKLASLPASTPSTATLLLTRVFGAKRAGWELNQSKTDRSLRSRLRLPRLTPSVAFSLLPLVAAKTGWEGVEPRSLTTFVPCSNALDSNVAPHESVRSKAGWEGVEPPTVWLKARRSP